MAATALIVFEQNAVTGTAGEAYEGTVADGVVTVTNDDNTDVTSWSIELLNVPSDSALVPGVLGSAVSNTPSANFTPDVSGSYRIQLTVSDGSTSDVDIRNFGIRNERGIIIPPYQKLPDPLPVLGSGDPGEKPDELNFGGQTRGWSGSPTSGLLEEFFRTYDHLPFQSVSSTPFSAAVSGEPPLYIVDLPTLTTATFNLPTSPSVGKVVRIATLGPLNMSEKLTVVPQGGGLIGGVFSSLDMFGGSSATLIHRGSNNWESLGGKFDFYERSIVSGVETTDLTSWTRVGSAALDPDGLININPSTVMWGAVAETTNVGDPAQMRLFNVTTATVVAGSTLDFTSTTATQQTATITLASGLNVYEAQLRLTSIGDPNRAICTQAQIIFSWFQL